MQKRIYFYFVGLILICVIVLAISFNLLFMNAARTHDMAAVRDNARLITDLLNQSGYEHVQNIQGGRTRMTIISSDGWVFLDSHEAADLTDNRSDRAEFIEAVIYGSGEAIRHSDTLGANTFYYATRLQDGNVLRFSRTLNSLGDVLPSVLPVLTLLTLGVLALTDFIAHRLTKKIIKPLTEVDFENAETFANLSQSESLYEEILPYVQKIDNQKQEISKQLAILRHRSKTIDTIIKNMSEGLAILDENGLVLAANKSAREIFDIRKKRHINHKNIQHIHRDPEFIKAVQDCLEGKHLEISFARNDRMYYGVFNPVIREQTSQGAILFFIDTTQQFKADSHRREFTANVSHELKTPLTTISALAEMMESGMTKEEDIRDFSSKISRHSKRLINIIDDIIRLSEFDEGKVEKEFSAFDMYELAQSVVIAFKDKAAEKSITLELTGQPMQVAANSRLMDELLCNLVENGIKYNKDGGNVTIDISEDENMCKIAVTDTGIGIREEHQERVFERFYCVDGSRSKKTGGTGLGLSIVKHIIEHHKGRVTLESEEGMGTSITCYIPVTYPSRCVTK